MGEGEKTRLGAWSRELRSVHDRLREALSVTRQALAAGQPVEPAIRDLLLFCHGFCTALTAHHQGEDHHLFPAIAEQYPQLRDTLHCLRQDHSMIAHLLAGLQAAVGRAAPPAELHRHLEGVAAIMESHFRYEERQLLTVLETLALDADPRAVAGTFVTAEAVDVHLVVQHTLVHTCSPNAHPDTDIRRVRSFRTDLQSVAGYGDRVSRTPGRRDPRDARGEGEGRQRREAFT